MDERRVIHQLRAGRDFAKNDRVAAQMANFAYLIADKVAGECVIVDPAWDVDGIVAAADARGLRITGALITHYHPDHCGGSMMGFNVQGLTRLLATRPCPVHCHRAEAHGIRVVTGLSETDLTRHDSGDKVTVGEVEIELLHTPGHTPGSQCFRCGDALVSGDTLFLQGCGRVDLPGGDSDEMFRTVRDRLSTLPDTLTLFPGHDYGDRPSDTLGAIKRSNYVFRPPDLDSWRRMMRA